MFRQELWKKYWNIFGRQTDKWKNMHYANLGTLRDSSWKFEVNPFSSLEDVWTKSSDKIFKYLLHTDGQRKSSWKYEVNLSMRFGGNVLTRNSDKNFEPNIEILWLTDGRTGERKNMQIRPIKEFLKIWSQSIQ